MNVKLIIKLELIFLILLIIPSSLTNGWSFTNSYYAKNEDLRSETWILDFQNNGFNNPQWYYENLNDQDRKKIRQAFDYMIDRDHIINDIEQGLGQKTFSFIAPTTKYFLDNGTKPRTYDKDKAINLLSEVFGYTYNPQIDDSSTSYNETLPYFTLTFLLPNNNANRLQYGTEIANEWESIGIAVNIKETYLDNIPHPYYNWSDFSHGGYDALIGGFPDYGYRFKSPASQMWGGYALLYPSNFADLLYYYNTVLYDQNESKRNQAIRNYQQYIYDNVPSSVIFWEEQINIRNKEINGINDFAWTNYENWTYPGHANATILARTEVQYENLNPVFYTYKWLGVPEGHVAQDALYRGLFYTTAENNLLPENPITYPYFADWYNKSEDGLTWFVNIKQGLKWHDGVELNTSDVKFTFDYQKFNNITDYLNGPDSPDYLSYPHSTAHCENLGNLAVEIINATLVKFILEKPYAYFKEDILTMKIMPKHIIEGVSYDDLLSHSSNTGINGSVIGNGPYIFVNKNINPVTVTLQKWTNWDQSYNTLITNNKMNQTLPGSSLPTIEYLNFVTIEDDGQALEALKNGTADITLQYYRPFDFFNLLPQVTDPLIAVKELTRALQIVFYNPLSPIWGLIPVEPCIKYSDILCPVTSTTIEQPTSENTNFIDTLSFFFAFSVLSILMLYSRKKK